jgi:hypothetical protein
MTRLLALALVLVLVSAVSADAKGRTLRIALVDTSAQSQPIAMSGSAVAAFPVWAGLGTTINGERQMKGFIADWQKGTRDQRPDGLRRFRVSFYTGCVPRERELGCSAPEERLSYVVMYEYDPTPMPVTCTSLAREKTTTTIMCGRSFVELKASGS